MVATYITLPGRAVKFSPCTVMFPDSARLSTVKLLAYASFQRFAAVPKLYVSLASGIMFDVMSALIVIESVSLSPIVMLPSALMFPVA